MIHAIEVVAATTQASNPPSVSSPGPPDFVPSLLQDRMRQNVPGTLTEALPDQAQAVTQLNTALDGSGTDYYRGVRRFDTVDAKATVLDEVKTGVVADAKWYEVRYHECDHDEPADQRSGCPDWTAERSAGTVPSEV